MRTLPIVWHRLVKDGETCPRCGGTQEELQAALRRLDAELRPRGIVPTLEMREIDEASFAADPLSSNRIVIAGRPMEDWIEAGVGSSRCCAACGDADCRTIEVAGERFEAIPAELIVRAALRAAAQAQAKPQAPTCCSAAGG
jgi:hypothetical protein